MISKFFRYAFFFALLLNIFQYVNSKQIIDKYEEDIKTFKIKIEQLEADKQELEAALLLLNKS